MLKPYPQEDRGATKSKDGKYRFKLWRLWDRSKPMVLWIGLNPSLADGLRDDPTLRRMRAFSKGFGFGGFYVCNLFSLVTPYPDVLFKSTEDPIGAPEGNSVIVELALTADTIICCWGANAPEERVVDVMSDLSVHKLYCLGMNKDGSPKHPLYLAASTKLERLPLM